MTASNTNSKTEELVALTGLRGYFAWWVVLFHLGGSFQELFPSLDPIAPLWACGDIAVDAFFVLSGFVIAHTNEHRIVPFKAVAMREFLVARLARIYPVHVVQQLAWFLLATVAVRRGVHGFDEHSIRATDFLRNLLLVQAWDVPIRMYWNYPAWSISLEWLAYLSAPILLALTTRSRSQRWFFWVSSTAFWVFLLVFRNEPWGHFVRILCEFGIGAQLARLYASGSRPAWAGKVAFPLALLTIFAAAVLSPMAVGYAGAVPLIAVLIYVLSCADKALFFVGGSVTRYMGQASYSIYMTHALSITVLHQVLHPHHYIASPLVVRVAVFAAYLIGIFLMGAASYHIVEEPARRFILRRLGRR